MKPKEIAAKAEEEEILGEIYKSLKYIYLRYDMEKVQRALKWWVYRMEKERKK